MTNNSGFVVIFKLGLDLTWFPHLKTPGVSCTSSIRTIGTSCDPYLVAQLNWK